MERGENEQNLIPDQVLSDLHQSLDIISAQQERIRTLEQVLDRLAEHLDSAVVAQIFQLPLRRRSSSTSSMILRRRPSQEELEGEESQHSPSGSRRTASSGSGVEGPGPGSSPFLNKEKGPAVDNAFQSTGVSTRSKLCKLTGRRGSIEEIAPLLESRDPEEARKNSQLLRTAEHLKRIYGNRPLNFVLSAVQQLSNVGDDDMSGLEHHHVDMEKLSQITGRRASLTEIAEFLDAKTAEQALENAKKLWLVEHLKKKYGDRPYSPGRRTGAVVVGEGDRGELQCGIDEGSPWNEDEVEQEEEEGTE